jgi:cell division protein FtsX
VLIVNSTLARRLWPDQDPIGETLNPGRTGDHSVIGVVADVPRGLEDTPQAEMYVNIRQTDDWDSMQLVVRSARAPASFIPDVRAAIREFDPSLASNEFTTLDQILDRAMAPRGLITATLGFFSSMAVILAVIGLYGVIAYSVSRRTREMGIRLAIGAQNSDILRLVIGEGFRIAGIGVAIGLIGALALARVLRSLLFGIEPTDPVTLFAVTLLFTVVALLACWIPARRAAKIDPMVALRYE